MAPLASLPGFHAAQHAVENIFPILKPTDAQDLKTHSSYGVARGFESFLYLYDNVYGGLGISKHFWNAYDRVLETALDKIATCRCAEDEGCPACVRSAQCFSPAKGFSKKDALLILKTLLSGVQMEPSSSHEGEEHFGEPVPSGEPDTFTGEGRPDAGRLVTFGKGALVQHPQFRVGTVVEAETDGSCVIDFRGSGQKRLANAAQYVKLLAGNARATCKRCYRPAGVYSRFCEHCGNRLRYRDVAGTSTHSCATPKRSR